MARTPKPLTDKEILRALDETEIEIRILASNWRDHLPGIERARLLRLAQKLLRLLMRAGLR